MFLNRSVIFLVESFLKKETSLEQTRLEERRLKRESDVDRLGIELAPEGGVRMGPAGRRWGGGGGVSLPFSAK